MPKFTLTNNKPYIYTINIPEGRTIAWLPSNGKPVKKVVEEEEFEYIKYHTTSFEGGHLQIDVPEKKREDVLNDLVDREQYENNSVTDESIKELLKGNAKTMTVKLEKITDDFARRAVVGYIKKHSEELELSHAKIVAISKWAKVSPDYFSPDEE